MAWINDYMKQNKNKIIKKYKNRKPIDPRMERDPYY